MIRMVKGGRAKARMRIGASGVEEVVILKQGKD